MYHSNFIGYFLGKIAGVKKIIWCIRHSNLDPNVNTPATLKINKICAKLGKNVDFIAYNGEKAKLAHENVGYSSENGIVLDNGCDCEEYRFISEARQCLKDELGIPTDKKIVLSATKDHPIKDIPTFIKAISIAKTKAPDIVAVLCGSGVDGLNASITNICEENGLSVNKDIFLLGMRHDIPNLFSACDLYVLHSKGEAFPNVLIQAMACECLCISTDVGDAKRILNNDWFIVDRKSVV